MCETCFTGCGLIWPTASDGDTQHSYVERCDACDRFPDDSAAMYWLRKRIFQTWGAEIVYSAGWKAVNGRDQPYLDILDGNGRLFSLALVELANRR